MKKGCLKRFTLIELLVAMPPIAAMPRRGATGRANSRSFTLIELLVVIAIVMILMAIRLALPVIGRFRWQRCRYPNPCFMESLKESNV